MDSAIVVAAWFRRLQKFLFSFYERFIMQSLLYSIDSWNRSQQIFTRTMKQWASNKNDKVQECVFVCIQRRKKEACWIVNEGDSFSMHDWTPCLPDVSYIQHPIRPCSLCLSLPHTHTQTWNEEHVLSLSLSCKGTFKLLRSRFKCQNWHTWCWRYSETLNCLCDWFLFLAFL